LKRPTLNNSISISATSNGTTSNNPIIVDPAENHQQICEQVDATISTSPIIPEAIQMGFSAETIRHVHYNQCASQKEPFLTLSALVHALLELPKEANHTYTQDPYKPNPAEKAQTPLQELCMLKRQRQCKKCYTETATVVCIPCGHLASCKNCSQTATHCPVCMTKISNKIPTFIV